MKRHVKFALVYAVLAMVCGVFYREFTKAYYFTGDTALGKLPRLQRRKRCQKGYLLNYKVIYGRGCLLLYPVSGAPGRACRLCAKARPVGS